MQNPLFDIRNPSVPDITGLNYIENFITSAEEAALIQKIDACPWLHDLKRRVQHYGYKYDYKARAVNDDAFLGGLPEWLTTTIQKLGFSPDQAIINEYLPGQGISAHIDCIPCFDGTIASLSLGSDAVMQFSKGHERQELYLQPRSLITLSGPARYEWQHAIPARKSDLIDGYKIPRQRRISVTFRRVIVET